MSLASIARRTFLVQAASLLASSISVPLLADDDADNRVPSAGTFLKGLEPFDALMRQFCQKNQPLGASLAVAYRGKLKFAKGYRHADLARQEVVEPTSLFRIASLSKPVTATAVMKLVEDGQVELDQPILPLLPIDYEPADARMKEVTIRQCLQHTAGFDTSASGDPFAMSGLVRWKLGVEYPLEKKDVLRFALTRKLDFEPGTKHVYANVGYLMLGLMIEKVSRLSYEQYVRTAILSPLGIKQMRLAKTLPNDRADGEVQYRDSKERTGRSVMGLKETDPVPFPYGIERIENLAAVGGWLASSVDMVRFASGLFFPPTKEVLTRKTLQSMFAPPEIAGEEKPRGNQAYYACGWLVRSAKGDVLPWTCWHNGSLTGVSSLMVSRADGVTWAVLFNQDSAPDGTAYATKIDGPLHAPASEIKNWPEKDLFADYL